MEWQFANDAPIYAQLIEQIKVAIVTGVYPGGSRLPSVRELAAEAGVNPNTMQRAMTELERGGLVYSQRTAGRFVTEDGAMLMRTKQELALSHVRTFLDAMLQLKLQEEEIITLLRQETKKEDVHVSSGM